MVKLVGKYTSSMDASWGRNGREKNGRQEAKASRGGFLVLPGRRATELQLERDESWIRCISLM